MQVPRSLLLLTGITVALASDLGAQHILRIEDATTPAGVQISMPVLFDTTGIDVIGWSYGVCHDPALVTLVSVASGATTQTSKLGGLPDFETLSVLSGGFYQAVVVCFDFCSVLSPGVGQELAVPTYQPITPAGTSFEVQFCSSLGLPTVDVFIVELVNLEVIPVTSGATVMVGIASGNFRRGDTNLDGVVNIADIIFTLSFLFQGASAPGCVDSADTNDDGTVDLSDVIYTISYLFTGGNAPPAPGITCGPDGTPSDALDCAAVTGCP